MLRTGLWLPGCATAMLAAACASAPPPVQDPEQHLAAAEQALAAGDAAGCLARLQAEGVEAYPRRLRDRFEVAETGARLALGEYWDAFEVAEQFPDRHPHSELRPAIVELVWRIGRALLDRDSGFLFFWSDRRAARTVLEHLITRHPDSPRLADALRLLGDLALADGQYQVAQERFRDLMRRCPESEWVVYARFRFAMSIVAGLRGPDYDLDQMQLATRELRDFLAANPENPEFVATAGGALAQLLAWRSERHWRIADFYRVIDNTPGRRLHLERAASPEFAGTPFAARAAAELVELDRPATPAGAEAR